MSTDGVELSRWSRRTASATAPDARYAAARSATTRSPTRTARTTSRRRSCSRPRLFRALSGAPAGARPPGPRRAALRAATGRHGDDLARAPGREHPPRRGRPGAQLLELVAQPVGLVAQPVVLDLELEDPLDPGEVDALLLRQALHLAEQRDVARGVAPAAAGGRARDDETEPVVLPQRLRVHAGELRGDRDDEHRRVSSRRSRRRARSVLGPLLSGHRRLRCLAPPAGQQVGARVLTAVAAAKASSASRASPSSRCGTATWTVTSRSPGSCPAAAAGHHDP